MPSLTPQEPLSKVLPFVIGDSGNQRYGGYFQDEPNAAWRDDKRIDNVEEMRRSDATVKALLNALKAPILATSWDIAPADSNPEEEEIAEFCRNNLFGMVRTWKEFLREALTYFDFGFAVFEECWKFRENRIWLDDLAPRIQASIQKWKLTDGRRGVVQLIYTDETDKGTAEIPMIKLLVLTNDKEGDDPTGQSVLRPAWKHYYIKDKLYRIGAVSSERYGVGIPMITLPPSAGETESDKAYEMGQQIRSNEKSVIVRPNKDWEVTILVPPGQPQQAQMQELIQHHDRQIIMAGLAGFLGLGSDATGSYALSKDQSSFFLKHVEDKAAYVAEQITKQVIHRLVELNYGKRAKYPQLTYGPLGDIDYAEYSTMLLTLVNAGLLDKDSTVKQFTRKAFKLPELTSEQIEEMEAAELEKEVGALEDEEIPDEEIDS